jgi:hypothetical protein
MSGDFTHCRTEMAASNNDVIESSLCLAFLDTDNKASSYSLVILLLFLLVTGVDWF